MSCKRKIIPENTQITFLSAEAQSYYTVTVRNPVGAGGSCVTYEAEYTDESGISHDCLLKYLCPVRSADEDEERDFFGNYAVTKKEIERFIKASYIQQKIRSDESTLNTTSFIRSVFEYRACYFQIVEKQKGFTFDKMKFNTLNDYLGIINQIASVVCRYHSQGYLHLDIKPENVFCRTSEDDKMAVTMFDFDSLKNIDDISDSSVSLSCSKNYAPPELIKNRRNDIGISSDFYEIACMMFEAVFGRFPRSTEISGFMRIKFNDICFNEKFNEELIKALDSFFKHTLTLDVKKRYKTDKEFIESVNELYELSKTESSYIISNFAVPSTYFIGREQELKQVGEFISECGRAVITGFGGAGKSSVASQYASRHLSEYSSVVFLEYNDSADSLKDELRIHGKYNNNEEKFELFKSLCGKETLVIIDNLTNTNDIGEWLSLDCDIIITARSSELSYNIYISGLDEAQELFLHYYGCNEVNEEDGRIIKELIYYIDSHAMMSELLGKLCRHHKNDGTLSLNDVCLKFKNASMNEAGEKNIRSIKDSTPSNISVQKNMDILFSILSFNDNEKKLLQCLSLLPLKSISLSFFNKLYLNCGLDSFESLEELGIIKIDEGISLHPLVLDRVLYNFPPKAEDFGALFNNLSEIFFNIHYKSRELIRKISVHVTEHIQGQSPELAEFYLVMSYFFRSQKKKEYLKKSKEMFGGADIPFYFSLYEAYNKIEYFIGVDDKGFFENENAIEEFCVICRNAVNYAGEKKWYKYEQAAGLCKEVMQSLMMSDSGKKKKLHKCYTELLLKAAGMTTDEETAKRIYGILYYYYSDVMNPYSNDVKANEYRKLADMGIKIYGVPIDDEQMFDSDNLSALKSQGRLLEAMKLAYKWYDKYFNENVRYDPFMKMQIENLYRQTFQWKKYIRLIELDRNIEGHVYELEMAEAYFHLFKFNEADKYINIAVEKLMEKFNGLPDYDAGRYITALAKGMQYSAVNGSRYEEMFFSCCKSLMNRYLMEKSDDIALCCLEQSKIYRLKRKPEKAFECLAFYARFRTAMFAEKAEYRKFKKMCGYIGFRQNFFILMFEAEKEKEYGSDNDGILKKYKSILKMLDKENYDFCQLVYKNILELCDDKNAEKNADFERIAEMETELSSFDEYIERELLAVEKYRSADRNTEGDKLLEKILCKLDNYPEKNEVLCKAYCNTEKFFIREGRTQTCIDIAWKRYEISGNKAEVCADIAGYCDNIDDICKYLMMAKEHISDVKNNSDLFIRICEELAGYFESSGKYKEAIQEYQQVCGILIENNKLKRLSEIYNKLYELMMKTNDLNTAFYYESLRELILQEQ